MGGLYRIAQCRIARCRPPRGIHMNRRQVEPNVERSPSGVEDASRGSVRSSPRIVTVRLVSDGPVLCHRHALFVSLYDTIA